MTDAPEGAGWDDAAGPWQIRGARLELDRPLVMGILNCTPDSFSDGGELDSVDAALRRADEHLSEGAAVLDVGGESTRPGAAHVPIDEELGRVLPVIEAIVRRWSVPVSIDTRRARVASQALEAGARIVNDVSGFAFDSNMPGVVARAGAGAVLMHMRGTPADMRERSDYRDVTTEVLRELGRAVERAERAGIDRESLVLDPGFGFAKNAAQSLELLRDLAELGALGLPILVGPSRKSFLGEILDRPPAGRVTGTAVSCALAYERGARIFRVHDVGPTLEALAVTRAVLAADPMEGAGVMQGAASGDGYRSASPAARTGRTRT